MTHNTTFRPTHTKLSYLIAIPAAMLMMACGGDGASIIENPAAPSAVASSPSPAPATTTTTTTVAPSLVDAMTAALEDEYHAEAIYQRVLVDHGNVFPFANIIKAEQTHAASIARLFENRGLSVPANIWNVDNVPRFASVPEACAAAAQAEIDNAALYDRYFSMDLPTDVLTVFTNNRAASINNHLPAFNRCS